MVRNGTWRTSAEAMDGSDLRWTVRLEDLKTQSGIAIHDHRAVVRTGAETVLGVVGSKWKPVQPKEIFSFLDRVAPDYKMSYVGAGAFQGGRKVFVQTEIDGFIQPLPGDDVKRRIAFVTGYDGGLSTQVFDTSIRIVCENTLMMAVRDFRRRRKENGGQDAPGIVIRHVGNLESKLDEARRALGLVLKRFDDLQGQFKLLAGFRPSEAQVKGLLDTLFPWTETERTKADSMVGNAGAQNRIRELAETGKGTDIKGVKGTGWGWYNAVTEYVDHHRTTAGKTDEAKAENRLRSSWIGGGAKLKQNALAELVEMAN